MRKLIYFVLLSALCTPIYAAMPTVTIVGQLVDRQCSVDDVFDLQPSTEKRCKLWIREAPPGTRVWTVYCPNKAADGQLFNGAYTVCKDPTYMQIAHPGRSYIITGWLRTEQQQEDGLGQVQGFQFQN